MDISAFVPLIFGALLLILGLKNYKSHKDNFDVRYFRYATGISLILSGVARVFIIKNRAWIIIIAIILIFSIFETATYIRKKKHAL